MNTEVEKHKSLAQPPLAATEEESNPDQSDSGDEFTQEKYRKAYFDQLRKLGCPGCGETEIF